MSLDWIARQLAARPGDLNLTLPRYNPRPAGVIREGSASEKVLELLQATPKLWFTHHQIRSKTGCTQKALSWALIFLKSLELIESTPDEGRNSRYLRYRIKPVNK